MRKPFKRILTIMLSFCSLLASLYFGDVSINAEGNNAFNTTDVFPSKENVQLPEGWSFSRMAPRVVGNYLRFRVEKTIYQYQCVDAYYTEWSNKKENGIYYDTGVCDETTPDVVYQYRGLEIRKVRKYLCYKYLYVTIYENKTTGGTMTIRSYDKTNYRKARSGCRIKSYYIEKKYYSTDWLTEQPENVEYIIQTKTQYRWFVKRYCKDWHTFYENIDVSLVYDFDADECLVVNDGGPVSATNTTSTTYYYLKAGMVQDILRNSILETANFYNGQVCAYFADNSLAGIADAVSTNSTTASDVQRDAVEFIADKVAWGWSDEDVYYPIYMNQERNYFLIGLLIDMVNNSEMDQNDLVNEIYALDEDAIYCIQVNEEYYGVDDICVNISTRAVLTEGVNLVDMYNAGATLSTISEETLQYILLDMPEAWIIAYSPDTVFGSIGDNMGVSNCISRGDIAEAMLLYEFGYINVPSPVCYSPLNNTDAHELVQDLVDYILAH